MHPKSKILLWLAAIFLALPLAAAPLNIKLRVTQTDGPSRKADTNFRLAMTSGFSVVDQSGNYYFNGATSQRRAWKSSGTDMWDFELNWNCNDADCGYTTSRNPCDPTLDPTARDPRCGDSTGMWWISKNTPDGWWSFNRASGGTASIPQFPYFAAAGTPGAWPVRWPESYSATGIPDFKQTTDFMKVNANGVIPSPTPPSNTGCQWRTWNSRYLATGAANSKVVYSNGTWYMAFNETVNNPDMNGNWTASDNWRVLWAKSTDGQNWTIQPSVLFRSKKEDSDCGIGLMMTQLFIDNGYFYIVANDLYTDWPTLLRAPIDPSQPWGYGQWQIAADIPGSSSYTWKNTPADGLLDLVNGPGKLNPAYLMASPSGGVKQAAITRVYTSPTSSESLYIGIVVGIEDTATPPYYRQVLELWSAPDLNTHFTKQQEEIDLGYLSQPGYPGFKPFGLNGFEFAFTAVPGRVVGNEFDFWLIGNFTADPNDHIHDLVAFRTTATLSGDIFSPRAALRSYYSRYVAAENAGGGAVNADRTGVGPWETFTIVDRNGGTLQHGDPVNIQTANGMYIAAEGGGGAGVTANRSGAAEWETFTIEKKVGTGTINTGDEVRFRSYYNKYLVAENGGPGVVNCNRDTAGEWETFTIEYQP
jgi:hypothetical protein